MKVIIVIYAVTEDFGIMGIKKAFTLAEMMIVFIIIGIIISLGVSSVKPWEKSYKFAYHRMYNALSLAIYNHMVNTSDDDAFPKNASLFCEALLEYINTSEHLTNATDIKNYCSGRYISTLPTYPEADPIRPANGTKLWISSNSGKPYTMTVEQEALEITDTVRYYIVIVDLNGDKKPNTSKWKRDQMADTVAFAVTDKYSVIPLGYPEVDSRYLEANVVYPSFDSNSGDEETSGDDYRLSDAITYYEAKVQAFDIDNNGDIDLVINKIDTYDFNSKIPDSNYRVKHTDGSFKVKAKDNYNSHYETAPTFDDQQCNATGYDEPVCNVKIQDFH